MLLYKYCRGQYFCKSELRFTTVPGGSADTINHSLHIPTLHLSMAQVDTMPMFYNQAHCDRPLFSQPLSSKRDDLKGFEQKNAHQSKVIVSGFLDKDEDFGEKPFVHSTENLFGIGPLNSNKPGLVPAVGRVYLVDSDSCDVKHLPQFADLHVFSTPEDIVYYPFREDFGPFNLSMVYKFCRVFTKVLNDYPSKEIAFCGGSTVRKFTNSTFLLGAYLILEQDWSARKVASELQDFTNRCKEYCDITKAPQNFGLNLADCWAGLARAKELGWCGTKDDAAIDIEAYDHYDDPGNGDLHEVIPGKLIAFKGPRSDIDHWWVDIDGIRHFKPCYFHDIFDELNVDTVVRLNAAQYAPHEFESAGIRNVDLEFADGCAPPLRVVDAFMREVESAKRVVAVHCQAGLGRTGTLIALYLMKHFGFTARAAIGWVRIVRPGSISGEQQQFLCKMEVEWPQMPRGSHSAVRRHASSSRTSKASPSHLHSLPSAVSRR